VHGCCVYACSANPDPEESLCNAAQLKPAYQKSSGWWKGKAYPAFLANDGNRTNSIKAGSCIVSEEDNSWWVVDLGIPMMVKFLLLTNHGHKPCTFITLRTPLHAQIAV